MRRTTSRESRITKLSAHGIGSDSSAPASAEAARRWISCCKDCSAKCTQSPTKFSAKFAPPEMKRQPYGHLWVLTNPYR